MRDCGRAQRAGGTDSRLAACGAWGQAAAALAGGWPAAHARQAVARAPYARAVAAIALLLAACARSAPPVPTGARMLADGSYSAGPPSAAGPWAVPGTCRDGRFVPSGEIVGDGEVAEAGYEAWLELADGSLHLAAPGVAPVGPHVVGALGDDAQFRPHAPPRVRG